MLSENLYQIRNATINELGFFKQQTYQTHKFIDIHFDQFPQGFFVGTLNGLIISKIYYFNYQNKQGYIGGYYVKEQYRKKGYGDQLLNKIMKQLQNCQTIKLYCINQMANYYQQRGFQIYCKFHKRFIIQVPEIDKYRHSVILRKIQKITMDKVVQFDYKYIKYDRSYFVKETLNHNQMFVSIDCETDQILGYSCMSKFTQNDWIINIMIAINDQIAQDLIKEMLQAYKKITENKNKLEMKLYFYALQIKESIIKLGEKWFPQLEKINYYMSAKNKKKSNVDFSHIYSVNRN